MGCVSSTLLNQEDEFPQLGSTGLSHHIVSLTSTTYGLLSLDAPPSQSLPSSSSSSSSPTTTPSAPPRRFTLGSVFPSPLLSEPRSKPEVINSWELMAGLDNESFRFSPLPSCRSRPSTPKFFSPIFSRNKENSHPNRQLRFGSNPEKPTISKALIDRIETRSSSGKHNLDRFPKLCPPNGENKLVLYTTTLRGVRKTFEDCNAVRSAIQGLGFQACERDISMDRGFREELKELMKGKESSELIPPRVFVKGRYLGGAEEMLRIHEEGYLVRLFEGLPRLKSGEVCDGCGGARFLPCFQCNGSCKMVMVGKDEVNRKRRTTVVVRCSDCNENGLVLCPICS